MPFKDTKQGTTHSYNDGCGEPEHNDPIESPEEKSECKGTCEVEERLFGMLYDEYGDVGQNLTIRDFLRFELAKARQEERTQLLKEVGEKAEKLIEQIRETDLAIRKSDKTPKYEYSHKRCDANRDGEFPEAGARWAMPYELSNGLLRNAEDYLSAVKEILSANK